MKIFQIKLNKLQKILNTQNIEFKNKFYEIDWKKLNNYVNHPRKNKVNEIISATDEELLYKQLTLYILNNKEDSLIEIDLDNEQNIIQGQFEYIKSIYEKKNEVNILINENTPNNKILIEVNQLNERVITLPIKSDLYANINLNDINHKLYKLRNLQIEEEEPIDFFIDKINKLKKDGSHINKINDIIAGFSSEQKTQEWSNLLIKGIDHEKTLLYLYGNKKDLNLKIDLFSNILIDKVKNNLDNNQFILAAVLIITVVDLISNKNSDNDAKVNNENLDKIKDIFNNENLLTFLKNEKSIDINDMASLEMNILYEHLSKENKENLDIIKEFAESVTRNKSITKKINNYSLTIDDLKKIPNKVFKDKELVEKFILNCSLIPIIKEFKDIDNNWINQVLLKNF